MHRLCKYYTYVYGVCESVYSTCIAVYVTEPEKIMPSYLLAKFDLILRL